MRHLFPLLLALITLPFRADARTEAKNPQLGYSFEVPIGFEEVAAGQPGGPSGDTVQVFRHAALMKDPAGLTVSVKRLHSTLAQKPVDATSAVPWKGRTLPVSRTQETLDGTACVTFAIPVPLAREAVEIRFSGPVPREPRLRQVMKVILGSLEGESDWPAASAPPAQPAPPVAAPPAVPPKPPAPAPATAPSSLPGPKSFRVRNTAMGYTFLLPPNFRDATARMPKGVKPNMVQAFMDESADRPPRFVIVERLHGLLGPEPLPQGFMTAKGPLDLSSIPWTSKGLTLQMARVPEKENGVSMITFTVQVPLKGEAIQISVAGVSEAETSLRIIVGDILGSLEGEAGYGATERPKPWWRRMEPEAFGKLCGYVLVGVILLVVIAHKVFKKE